MHSSYEEIQGTGELALDRGAASGTVDRSREGVRTTQASLGAAVLATSVFLACTWVSWRRMGSLIVDGGKELDVPRRLVEGSVLYRDFAWNWGPLAPWLNAGLYRLFGVHSDTLMWAGLVSAALACLGLYLLARRFVGPFTSAWVSIAFLTVSAFGDRIQVAIFNFVAPFNFSATYGITLAIWSVLLLIEHARSGRPAALAGSAALAGLVSLTKMETTFAVLAAHGAFLLTVLPRPGRARLLAWSCGVAVSAAGYGVAARMSDGLVWPSLVGLFNAGSRFYILRTMGVGELGLSFLQVVASLLGWAAVIVAARWLAGERRGPRNRWLVALAWIALFIVPAVIVREKFFRAAPFMLAAGMVWILFVRRREGASALDGRWREHLVLWAFAAGALPRVFLRTGVDHYSFYLLPPTLVCVAVGMSRHLAAGKGPRRSRDTLALAASIVLAGVAVDGFLGSSAQFSRAVTEVKTARVWRRVASHGPEATLIPFLSRLPPSTICAAVPDGAGLIFAAGLTPPDDGMIAYLPMHLHGPEVERAVLEAWERRPPQVVVYWRKDQSDVFGFEGFGKDYGLGLAQWISERYEAQATYPGPTSVLVPRPRS